MKVLAVYNLKGGVGKTSTAVNVAYLAAEGMRTLLWDLDAQGAATYCFRVKPKVKGGARGLIDHRRRLESAIRGTDYPDLDLVPADFSNRDLDLMLGDTRKPSSRLRAMVRRLEGDYDLVILDCPPSASLVSENVFRASDALLLPVIPTPLSLRAYAQLLDHLARIRRQGPRLMPFFSMVDRRKKLHRETVERWVEEHPEVLRTDIPYASVVEQMSIERRPVPSLAPGSPTTRAYRALWREVAERL